MELPLQWALLLATACCVACFGACVVLLRLALTVVADAQRVLREFEERLGKVGGLEAGAARDAAAWGAEVLADIGRGVAADVAVRRSAARMRVDVGTGRLQPVHENGYAASEAGSDAASEAELGGVESSNGSDWIVRAARSVGATPPPSEAEFEGVRARELREPRQAGERCPPDWVPYATARAPTQPYRRASASPPRGRVGSW